VSSVFCDFSYKNLFLNFLVRKIWRRTGKYDRNEIRTELGPD
jgi:hypothetical protein